MHCLGMPFNGDTVRDRSLGGSETAAWALARELAKRDHQVTLFTMGEPGKFNGVRYENVGPISEQFPFGQAWDAYSQSALADACIAQRAPGIFGRRVHSKVNLWWTHDLALKRFASGVVGMAWNVDRYVAVSEWHRQQVHQVYGIPLASIAVGRNGIYPEDFAGDAATHGPGVGKKRLTYTSRPERGLVHLVREGGIMEQLGDDYHLVVCHYDNTTPDMAPFYQQLWSRCQALPNVTLLPPQTKADLYGIMRAAWLHVYPSEFEETSCITAMETQAAGLPFLGSRCGALPETLDGAGAELIDLKDGQADEAAFVRRIKHLADKPEQYARLKARTGGDRYDWSGVAEEWENLIESCFSGISVSVPNLARHYLRSEDIMPLRDLASRCPDEIPADVTAKMQRLYGDWIDDQEKYRAKYAEHYTFEAERGTLRPQIVPDGNPRLSAVLSGLADLPSGARVLDLGPAEGAMTLGVAKARPDLTIVSVELDELNIAVMRQAVSQFGLGNVEIYQGDQFELPDEAKGCDAILAGEVLEHLPDPVDAIRRLWAHCGLDRKIRLVLTTPYGPWSSLLSPELLKDHEFLAHLWHFEPDDWRDILGKQMGYRLLVAPTQQPSARDYFGQTVVACTLMPGIPLGSIDLERKHRRQAPRHSLSLCMIAKDAETTIAKTIKSTGDLPNEVIVAVDRTTTDRTREIARDLGAVVFDIPSPLEIGFDAARNLSIEQAAGDWILWLDSDEEMVGADNGHKYLRQNCIGAYMTPQHHFAVEPLGVLQTDLPCRIFRNRQGGKFWGAVHEHPETAPNAGLGVVLQIGDVSVAHPAYQTEAVRRQRFVRNWPLMRQEWTRTPRRHLTKLLYLRDVSYLARGIIVEGWRPEQWGLTVEDCVAQGTEAFSQILESKIVDLALQALPYYSMLNELARRGFGFDGTIIGAAPLGAAPNGAGKRVAGIFATRKELDTLIALIVDQSTAPLQEKYL